MKCSKGHDMQPIIVHVRPQASEWYCGHGDPYTDPEHACHESIGMTADEIHQMSGGRLVVDEEPTAPAPRARR